MGEGEFGGVELPEAEGVADKESAPFYREITENEVYRHLGHGPKIIYPFSKTAKNDYRNP